ncbi:hypothetical protein M413DRAFT_77910 [Hebeloma cylindrosporum]|uniref:ATP-dependent RNA helicase n=1 Tax=Hebeloma cylindrosporum TaxID=76867 RepID=A0A0C3BX77_HEBCY|nr:hypothetical protein M413DRAFT_77910 [Hebeloma cylindrosporum h7]
MLLVRNASTAAARAHIPVEKYKSLDDSVHFNTISDTIHPHTFKAITVRPFQHTHMSIVQAQIFPLLPELALRSPTPPDLLVKAKTGTGKTMAFLVPAIEARANAIKEHVQQSLKDSGLSGSREEVSIERAYAKHNVGTLVISPTRELATQIAVEATNLTSHHPGYQVQLLLGGESKHMQMRSWTGRKDIVVATPGRLLDLIKTEPSVLEAIQNTRTLVLDEADTLLDLGFQEDIQRIIKYLPPNSQRQTFLFSATVSPKVQEVARAAMSPGHKFINCVLESDTDTHAHIDQYHTVLSSGADLLPHVLRLIAHDQLLSAKEGRKSKVVVFLNTTKMVQLFSELMKGTTGTLPFKGARKTTVYEMHSQRTMSSRTRVSAEFRNDTNVNKGAVLVTSDVSARGVDYPGVTRVIQVGVPSSGDVYTHRVGRTGRAGRAGRGDLVLMSWEMGFVRRELADVGLKPLKVDNLKEEIVELIEEAKGASIDTVSAEVARDLAASDLDATSGALTSTLGFYLGRLSQIGCRSEDMVNGMQSCFQQMCGLTEPLRISRRMMEMLGGGGGSPRTQSRSGGFGSSSRGGGYGGGGYGSGGYGSGGYGSGGSRGGYGSVGSRSGNDRNTRGSWADGRASRGGRSSFGSRREGGGYGSSSSFGGASSSYGKPSFASYDKPSFSTFDNPSSYGSSRAGRSFDKPAFGSSRGGGGGGRSSAYTPRSREGGSSYSPGGYGAASRSGFGVGSPGIKKRSWDDDE